MIMKALDLDQAIFFIYPDLNVSKESHSSSKDSLVSIVSEIREFFASLPEYKDYFWHDEGIHWEIMEKSTNPFICGKIKFGDGMEDEWFILKLLLKLSQKFSSFIISIFDTDGDFILIEAAEVLPEWLEPESSKNRVFIHQGTVKIIPSDIQKDPLRLQDALKHVREGKAGTRLNEKIMEIIKPKLLEDQKLHKTKVMIPVEIMKVLIMKKQLIGPIISSFYNRDPGTSKSSKFPTEPATLYTTTIPMTRIQFAQLACQEIEGFDNSVLMKFDHPIAAELGIKLALGYELLMSSGSKFVEQWGDSVISVQEEIKKCPCLNMEVSDMINHDPEDSLDWMEIDENVLDSDLQSKLEKLTMNELEESELIETWTKEYEKGENVKKIKEGISEIDDIVEKMKKMIESTSNYEGIDLEDDEPSNDDEEYSDDEKVNDDSENDDNLLENEIFETINYDPDLLMKIIEFNSHSGVNNEEFLTRFRKYQEANPNPKVNSTQSRQKGIADIDIEKVEEARKSSRKTEIQIDYDEVVKVAEKSDQTTDEEGDDVSDEFIYGQTYDQFKRVATNIIEFDNSEIEDEKAPLPLTMKDYYTEMDRELSISLQSSESPPYDDETDMKINLAKNLIESISGGDGPARTVLTGLGKRIPRPN